MIMSSLEFTQHLTLSSMACRGQKGKVGVDNVMAFARLARNHASQESTRGMLLDGHVGFQALNMLQLWQQMLSAPAGCEKFAEWCAVPPAVEDCPSPSVSHLPCTRTPNGTMREQAPYPLLAAGPLPDDKRRLYCSKLFFGPDAKCVFGPRRHLHAIRMWVSSPDASPCICCNEHRNP